MSIINLQNIRQADGIIEELHDVRIKIEQRINLEKYSAKTKPLTLNNNKIMRVCLLAGLSNKEQRSLSSIEQIQISKTGNYNP
jgi:hypothetical protein